MPGTTSAGECQLCGRSYRKSGITTHLRRCLARHAAGDDNGGGDSNGGRSIHLAVEDTYRPEYWLHLAVPAAATLEQLDACLRSVWMECCYHLSAFRFGRNYYDRTLFEDDAGDDVDSFFAMLDDFWNITRRDMNVALAAVAPPGTRFHYEYDFGATNELVLRSVAEIDAPAADADNTDAGDNTGAAAPIRLLARNAAPEFACRFCGSPAIWVSPAPDDWIAMTAGVCDQCVPRLENADYRLPIVNSPRSGVCGYTGAPIVIVDDDE